MEKDKIKIVNQNRQKHYAPAKIKPKKKIKILPPREGDAYASARIQKD